MPRLVRQRGEQGRVEGAGRDRHHAHAAARQVARRRQREADDAALGRGVGDLADLTVEGGDRRGADADAPLASLVRLVVHHRGGGQPQDVEGADQVDLDHVVEELQVVGPLPSRRALCPADSRAADRDPQPALGARRRLDRRLYRLRLDHVCLDEAGALAELGGELLALLRVQVAEDDARPGAVQRAGGGRPQPRRATCDQRTCTVDPHRRLSLVVSRPEFLRCSLLPFRRPPRSAPSRSSPSAWRRRVAAPSN